MRQAFLLMALALVSLFSCKKTGSDSLPTSVEGTWKMVLVKDVATGALVTKPSSMQGDVTLIFTPNNMVSGTITGKTPTNYIWPSDYLLGPGSKISIPVLSMTKVGETSWGNEFVNNIRQAQSFHFEATGKLIIQPSNKVLTFKRQ